MSYTSYADLYKIREISFTGGSTVLLDFEVSSSTGEPFNIEDYTFTWKLSPYGEKNQITLTKSTYEFISSNVVRFTLSSSDTQGISGKYIQELTSLGDELVYGSYTDVKTDFELVELAQASVPPDEDVSTPSSLYIVGSNPYASGEVIINGLDINDFSLVEGIQLNGTQEVDSVNVFSTIESIDFPARLNSGDTVTVGVRAQLFYDVSEVTQGIVIIHKKLG